MGLPPPATPHPHHRDLQAVQHLLSGEMLCPETRTPQYPRRTAFPNHAGIHHSVILVSGEPGLRLPSCHWGSCERDRATRLGTIIGEGAKIVKPAKRGTWLHALGACLARFRPNHAARKTVGHASSVTLRPEGKRPKSRGPTHAPPPPFAIRRGPSGRHSPNAGSPSGHAMPSPLPRG